MQTMINTLHDKVFGEEADGRLMRITLAVAVGGFLLHLLAWVLFYFNVYDMPPAVEKLLGSPLSALYTPFTILLGYEVYQIIKAIPESFSTAVGKQYEVATLLVVRDVFKRLSDVNFSGGWTVDNDLSFVLLECLAFLALFHTALKYQEFSSYTKSKDWDQQSLEGFVTGKKAISLVLMFTFVTIAALCFTGWAFSTLDGQFSLGRDIFFSDFFTCLILADILILLISYRLAHDFYSLVRNTSFVLSTVLLRVAITAPGVSGILVFLASAALGVMVLNIAERRKLESTT